MTHRSHLPYPENVTHYTCMRSIPLPLEYGTKTSYTCLIPIKYESKLLNTNHRFAPAKS